MRDELLSDEEFWDKYKGPDSKERLTSLQIGNTSSLKPSCCHDCIPSNRIGYINRIVGCNRISEAGPAERFWPVVFLEGCNLRCPYCLNSSIIKPDILRKHIKLEAVIAKLDEWGEEGVMISGGEPLMPHEKFDIFEFVNKLAKGGRKVGIATNGTFPDTLQKLITSNLISFVAVDYKLCRNISAKILSHRTSIMNGYPKCNVDIEQSISQVFEWHENCAEAESEIRITLYPKTIDRNDVLTAAVSVHENSTFVIQQYRQNRLSDGTGNPVLPYSDDIVSEMYMLAKQVCAGKVQMRYP